MAGRVQPRQLAFALPHAESLTRDNFQEGPANAAALALIDSWPEWPSRTMMLVGPEGSGKSHLAAIWADEAGARSTAAHALGAADVPDALTTGALVVEDLRPRQVDERALFHLLNLAREQAAFVLMTGRMSPSAMEVDLRDLGSRLRALPKANSAAVRTVPRHYFRKKALNSRRLPPHVSMVLSDDVNDEFTQRFVLPLGGFFEMEIGRRLALPATDEVLYLLVCGAGEKLKGAKPT